jgi:RHS repeat-associated protein
VAERYEYDAWGNVMGVFDGNGGSLPSSVLGNRYLFQGREYSWATHAAWDGAGLYYFRARYYDPSTGRWLSNDPIGISGGLNQYAFCANNPVMFGDPFGLLTFNDLKGLSPSIKNQMRQGLVDTVANWKTNPLDARERGGHVVVGAHDAGKQRASQTEVSPPPSIDSRTGLAVYGWPDDRQYNYGPFNIYYWSWRKPGFSQWKMWFTWHTHPPIDDGIQPPSAEGDLLPGKSPQFILSKECVFIVNGGKITEQMPTGEFFQ